MSDSIETTLFSTPLVFIYSIAPLKSISTGYKASQWQVDNPIWKGRLRVVEIENSNNDLKCQLKFDDPETNELFAIAPYSSDGSGVTAVTDSSRFFAITVVDGSRRAVLGMGFPDRNSSFEFNIALQDFKRHSTPIQQNLSFDKPKDYSLKDGQTIHINMPSSSSINAQTESTEPTEIPTLLPPPPPSSRRSRRQSPTPPLAPQEDDFGDFQ